VAAVALVTLVGFYAGYSWYWWRFPGGETLTARLLSLGFLGGVVLFLLFVVAGVYFAFFNSRTCEYLIDTDGELRKVVWPAVQPLFDPQAEAWGATYVVIGCAIVLTVYIGIVDWALHYVISLGLLRILFPGKGL